MTNTLDDLRAVLATRAAVTTFDTDAARARLDARRAHRPSRTRPGRRLLVAVVAAVAVGGLGAAVVAAADRPPVTTTAPATVAAALPLTDYLFDVDAAPLAAAGLSAWFGGADSVSQRAFVEPAGAAPHTAYSAVVQVAYDAVGLGVATRPAGATDATVGGIAGWTAPHTVAGDDRAYGIDGFVTTWTDSAGLTAKVVATDRTVLDSVTAAVRLGQTHPVRFPASFSSGTFPAGSRIAAVETDPTGARLTLTRPGQADLSISISRPGTNVTPQAMTSPLAGTFRYALPRLRDVDLLTDGVRDVEVDSGEPTTQPGDPAMSLDDLARLIGGMTFADLADSSTWPTVTSVVPLG